MHSSDVTGRHAFTLTPQQPEDRFRPSSVPGGPGSIPRLHGNQWAWTAIARCRAYVLTSSEGRAARVGMFSSTPTGFSELSGEQACLGPSAGFAHDPSAVAAAPEHCTPTPPRWACIKTFTLSKAARGCSVLSHSLRPHGPQHARPPCPSPAPRACSNSCPSSGWCQPTISSSVVPFIPALNLSQHHGLFQWVGSLQQVAKVLEFRLQHQSFQWIFRADFL